MSDRRRPSADKARQTPASIADRLSGVLVSGLKRAQHNLPLIWSARRRLEPMGLIKTERDHFSSLTTLGRSVLAQVERNERAASGKWPYKRALPSEDRHV